MDLSRNTDEIITIKFLILGDRAVGKTSLMARYINNDFNKSYMSTLGIEFKSKIVQANGENFCVQIWDSAGQEKFRSITRTYYRRASGIILAYDSTSSSSFDNIRDWVRQINSEVEAKVPMVLVATKCDADKKISLAAGKALAKELDLMLFETSSLLSTGVQELFAYLIELTAKTSIARYSHSASSVKLVISKAKSETKQGAVKKKKCC